MDNQEGEAVPYFDFTTVSMHGKVNNMHDDALQHRAKVDYLDNGDCWVKCSCDPRMPWKAAGINASSFAIQKSFERHLARDGHLAGG